MSIRSNFVVLRAICITCLAVGAHAQIQHARPDESPLQKNYIAAQRFQQAGKMDEAVAHYRAFLGDALGELASGHAHLGEYEKAASLFDEALILEPDSLALRLGYARTKLSQGDLSRVEALTRALINDHLGDANEQAEAHQILGRALLKMNRNQEARKELELAVALDPSFANGYDLAVICLDLDDEKCAAQLFGEMQASFGDTAPIHMHFGRAYGDSDFQAHAVTEFRNVIAKNPQFPGAHYSLAAALLSAGDGDANAQEVESELKKELTVSPNDFLTYAALGQLAATHQKYPEAENYLQRAISLNPKNPDAYLYLGQMYFDTDRFAEAGVALHQAIKLTTDQTRNRFQIQKAHFLLGRILMREHRETEAHSEMQLARELAERGLSQDRGKLAGLLQDNSESANTPTPGAEGPAAFTGTRNDADPAAMRSLNAFEKQLTPAIADSYNNLGATAASGRNYADALRYFGRAAEWSPSLEGLDYNWGRAAFMSSRFQEAIPPLSRYLSSHSDDSGIRGALAMSQFMTENYKGCIDTIRYVEESIAAIPQMQFIYAESMVRTGQLVAGTERLQSLATAHPEIADVHRSLGEAFYLQGEMLKAKSELRNALKLNVNDPEAHYDLGEATLKSGDAAAAIPELETAVRLQPDDLKYHRLLADAYRVALRTADSEKELRIYSELSHPQVQPAKAETEPHEPKTP